MKPKKTRFYIDLELPSGKDSQEIVNFLERILEDSLPNLKVSVAPEGVPRTYIVDSKVYAEQPWWTEIILNGKSQEQLPLNDLPNGFRVHHGEQDGNQSDPHQTAD